MARNELILYEYTGHKTRLNISEISDLVGLHPDLILRFYQLGLIDPLVVRPRMLFDEEVVSRIELIMRLKTDLEISFSSCGLILDLLDKIDQLEKRVHYYEMILKR